ncbi:MAG: 16S rRNA (uracil(1498)-N(3))-methyltransferase [Proteobacteria bacterium]|nr:16S rRNA (uracil(1498)-N(3))-methyltransferase [Pseudomonadota bacterium]
MTLPRIYFPFPLRSGEIVTLDKQAAQHVLRVLRLAPGDALTLFNGQALDDRYGEYQSKLQDAKGAVLVGDFIARDTESPLHITLAQAISRGERMDYAVQKAAELGVTQIVPLITEFCVVKMVAPGILPPATLARPCASQGERTGKRVAHWQGIATSACEQSGRVRVPGVSAPQTFADWLPAVNAGVKLVLDPLAQTTLRQLPAPQGDIVLLAGPEGGLSDAEVAQAKRAGFTPVRLGPRILRTETVPAAALAALQVLWGDWA